MLCHNGWKDYSNPAIVDILSKTDGVDFELIAVDNGSTDETKLNLKPIASKDSRLVPLLLKENLGFSGGNNEAFKIARGKYIVFINNDVLVRNRAWLKTLLEEKKKNPNAILGQQLIRSNTWTAYRNNIFPYIGGWCVFASKEDFDKIITRWGGPWGNDFGKGFFEDVWMSIQFSDLGYKLIEKDSGLEHLGSKTVSKMDPDEMTKYARKVYNHFHIMREKCGKRLRIVFYYPFNRRFNEEDYEGELGVGGSEASLIQLTRELAKMGHIVDVYNDCTKTGVFNGVCWNHLSDFSPDEYCDVFVLFRNVHPALHTAFAKSKIFFSCDQYTNGNWAVDVFPYVDAIIAISDFHKKYMIEKHGAKPDKVFVMDLGVSSSDYRYQPFEKIKNKMIFCSVPERGLRYVGEAFRKVKQAIPDTTLVITSDYTLWGAKPLNEGYKNELSGQSGITFMGKVSRKELVKQQLQSEIMFYPCNYDENFCISAAECMSAGAVPVTTRQGALPTTVGECGVIINKVETDDGFVSEFAREVISLLNDRERLAKLSNKCTKRASSDFYWDKLAVKYLDFLNKFLSEKEVSMTKCNVCNEEFPTSFEMFKHRNKEHPLVEKLNTAPDAIVYRIRTKKPVFVSLNTNSWEGKDLEVPKELAGEVMRIINECYGADVIDHMAMGL